MERVYKKLLIQKYEAFDFAIEPRIKKLLQFEVFNILRGIEDYPDSNDLHIWGLTYYMADKDETYDIDLALEKFLEAYQTDSSNFMACLYIAYCYHDKVMYEEALKYYEMVDQKVLRAFQLWRYVKLIEQIGFCHYQLGRQVLGRQMFQTVLEWYRKLAPEDRVVPSEMLACLPASDEIITEMKTIEDYLE